MSLLEIIIKYLFIENILYLQQRILLWNSCLLLKRQLILLKKNKKCWRQYGWIVTILPLNIDNTKVKVTIENQQIFLLVTFRQSLKFYPFSLLRFFFHQKLVPIASTRNFNQNVDRQTSGPTSPNCVPELLEQSKNHKLYLSVTFDKLT